MSGRGIAVLCLIVAAAAAPLLYWVSAGAAATDLLEAYEAGNAQAVDESFNWEQVIPALGDEVAKAFPSPAASNLGRLVAGAFRDLYLAQITQDPQSVAPQVSSRGFTGLSEYTISTSRGNRLVLRLHGLHWRVEQLLLPEVNVRVNAFRILGKIHPQAGFHIVDRDLYFDEPEVGCRLTTSGDVESFAVSPRNNAVAFVRKAAADASGPARGQLWELTLPALSAVLLSDGKTNKDPRLSTANPAQLAYSANGRYLYFTADAWPTSRAVVEYDVMGGTSRYVTDGNTVIPLNVGPYAGDLVTTKRRLGKNGPYEWAYVVSREGTEVENSGREIDAAEYARSLQIGG